MSKNAGKITRLAKPAAKGSASGKFYMGYCAVWESGTSVIALVASDMPTLERKFKDLVGIELDASKVQEVAIFSAKALSPSEEETGS